MDASEDTSLYSSAGSLRQVTYSVPDRNFYATLFLAKSAVSKLYYSALTPSAWAGLVKFITRIRILFNIPIFFRNNVGYNFLPLEFVATILYTTL